MKGNPFFLDEEGENWVLDTWKNMSLEQKCGQVFCPMGFNGEEETLKHFTQDIQVGGLMYRADSAENIQDIYRKLQAFSNIPLLLAANTEAGGISHSVSIFRIICSRHCHRFSEGSSLIGKSVSACFRISRK